jgi:hypothetical protein
VSHSGQNVIQLSKKKEARRSARVLLPVIIITITTTIIRHFVTLPCIPQEKEKEGEKKNTYPP